MQISDTFAESDVDSIYEEDNKTRKPIASKLFIFKKFNNLHKLLCTRSTEVVFINETTNLIFN